MSVSDDEGFLFDRLDDETLVQCPYCFEMLPLYVDPGVSGVLVQDCDVCCRPWRVHVGRDEEGRLSVTVTRAQ